MHDWSLLAKQANWSVNRLARLCGVSPRTLERYFLQSLGRNPKEWLIEGRQKLAHELLRGGFSVKETSSILGFRQATTFAREFKRLSGHAPSEFAKGVGKKLEKV